MYFPARAGRRVLLMLSSSVMALCLAVLGVHFYLLDTGVDLSSYGLIPLASVVLFIIMFALGFGPIPWTMMGELFPAKIKGGASALACVENYILVFVVTKTFQNLLDTLGSAPTFWMFSSICVLGTVFVFFAVPETKGKTLDEIQEELAK
jgi:facilitated trehalose transporter